MARAVLGGLAAAQPLPMFLRPVALGEVAMAGAVCLLCSSAWEWAHVQAVAWVLGQDNRVEG